MLLVRGLVPPEQEAEMVHVKVGQCGLCMHFGEHHETPVLIKIRSTRQAPEEFIDDCGHPRNAKLNLHVTPIAGCDGFEMAAA